MEFQEGVIDDYWPILGKKTLDNPNPRWAPTGYKWNYNPYKWVTYWGYFSPISGVITHPILLGNLSNEKQKPGNV